MIRTAIEFLGQRLIGWLGLLGGSWRMVWGTALWTASPRVSGVGGLRRQSIAEQMVRVGIRALPIVCLVNLIVGMILAVSMGGPMRDMNYINAVPKIVALAITRQLAPMMTAIVMCGFVGAAMAAELGTMTVSEEVLALEVSGLNPVRFLVVPRMLAVVAMIPCLTVLANFAGMFGGYLVGTQVLGIGSALYQSINNQAASAWDIVRGAFMKGPLFGVIITAVACHEGLSVKGGAEGVGRATTRAVVASIVAVILADLFMTALFITIWGSEMAGARAKSDSVPAIEVRGVVLAFEDRRVLNGVDLRVMPGERMVILGSSGGGKSTLLRVMLGAYRPDSGEVLVFGRDTAAMSEDQFNELRRRWGAVFQGGALYNSMTVGENVALPLRENTLLDDNIIAIMVRMKLELVGLSDFEDLKPAQLSGGMAKRVSLARALALDPEILFFDEPTTGLDPVTAGAIMRLINDLTAKTGATSVIVTQDMNCAFTCADRIALLYNGRVHALGTPEEIRASADPLVKQFINGEPDGPIPFRLCRNNCTNELRSPDRARHGKRAPSERSGPVASG